MKKLDELQEQTCQANRQNWNKTESLSKAVPKAGPQEQERCIRYVQETLETSVPLEPPSHGRGGGGRSRWCQGSGMGRRSLAGLRYMSCMSGENSNLQRALGMVSLVVDIGRGEPEDNSKDEGRAGERK